MKPVAPEGLAQNRPVIPVVHIGNAGKGEDVGQDLLN